MTQGAAKLLNDTEAEYWNNNTWDKPKLQKSLLELSKKINVYGKKLSLKNLKNDPHCKNIPGLNENTVSEIINDIDKKVQKGIKQETDQTFYHTGPHHDDIMLGLMPYIIQLIREPTNYHHFVNMTSGFTSVTNNFIIDVLLRIYF